MVDNDYVYILGPLLDLYLIYEAYSKKSCPNDKSIWDSQINLYLAITN